jgi:hypothetical protein
VQQQGDEKHLHMKERGFFGKEVVAHVLSVWCWTYVSAIVPQR